MDWEFSGNGDGFYDLATTAFAGNYSDYKPGGRAIQSEVPPIQPSFRRGSVLIRDMRLWHAGMPNHTHHARPMIAMIHVPRWLDARSGMVFPASTQPFFANARLQTCARFVEIESDIEIDHIHAPHGYEYVKP